MRIRPTAGLEPSGYWQKVCAMADELLALSPLRSWSVTVAPPTQWTTAERLHRIRWHCKADYEAKELMVTVPPDSHDADEGCPEDVASHIIFDLLWDTVVAGHRKGSGDTTAEQSMP